MKVTWIDAFHSLPVKILKKLISESEWNQSIATMKLGNER